MANYRDGLKVATCLFEAAAWHYAVQVTCRCGHSAAFHPHGLWWHFHRKRLDDSLTAVRDKMWCRACWHIRCQKMRPVRLDLVKTFPADIVTLELPDEREWKRMVNRFRG